MALKSSGFTLAEAVISAAALGMIMIVTSALLLNTTRFNQQASARAFIQRDARTYVEGITRELAEARGHTIVIDRFDSSQPPYSRLTFSTDDGTVSYYQSGQRLYRKTTVGASVSTALVADGLRQAAFSYPRSDSAGLVGVALSFERAAGSGATKPLEVSVSHLRVQNPDAY